MESNSWRPAQTEPSSMEVPSADWRSQLLPEARQRIVNKIMDTLRRHLPVAVPEGMKDLQNIALRFEEKIYTVAVNQSDYLRKISLKMLSMESKTLQAAPMNSQPGVIQNSTDAGSVGVPSQVNNQVQTMSTISVVNQPPVRQQLLPQNLQNNAAASMQVSSSLSASPSIPGRSQSTLPHYAQMSNMQSMPGMSHNAVNNSLPQGSASDIYANATRQTQPRPQPQSILSQQQQQQTQGPLLYPNQLQSQLSKQKIHNNALLQQPIQQQQQQQQSLLQTNQLQPSQQTMMQMSSSLPSGQSSIQQSQPASVQSTPQSTLQQNHLNSIQQSVPSLHPQHVQAIARQTQQAQPSMHQQTSSLQQQAASMHQQSNLQTQQHQQLMGQQANLSNISSISNISNVSNISNIQHNQLLGQQNNIADIKPQQQRLPVQQNNLVNMQQSQPLLNQQTLSLHPQQLGQQTNMQGLPQQLQPQNQQQQQQPLLASLPNVSNMQTHQRSMQLLQQSKNMPQSQQQLQPSMSLLQSQGQQSHHQPSQQQLMSQIHSQPGQLQQQPNSMQREVQQRLQAPGTLLQPQSAIEQQKQFMQSQRGVAEVSSVTSMDSTAQTGHISGDWQEELYQKIQSLKEEHLAELQGFHQKITLRIQQHDTMPHSKQSANYERLKSFKMFLEQIMAILQIPKNNIPITLKEKLPMYESHINSLLSSRKSKVMPLQQPGQLQLQNQLQTSQVSQVQQHDSMGNQVQQINMPGSVTSMHAATASSMQHGSMTISGLAASMTQQSLMNSVQSSSSFDAVQTSSFSSLQHGSMGTVQQSVMGPSQNSLGAAQQTNLNGLSQSSIGALQPNASSIQSSSVLQQQHLKQQQEHVIQNQQLKQQLQQRQMQQQQVFHQQQRQQQLQQPQQPLQQQQKQQPASQLPVHQISQLHPMNELNELKARPVAGIKAGLYQQPYPGGQRQNYYHQQLKPSPSFPISSPQNLQASSPQISHNSSPQIDQHNLLPMLTKSGTPMQSTGSPFVVPSPSTPIARSPIPGDSEKLVSCLVSLPTTGQSIHQQCSAPTQAQSIAVVTPGMSASPLLADSTTIEVNQPVMSSSKTSASDRPLERLIKAVRSFSSKALSSAVSDIGSVVSMIDRIAGSAPGNGSRAAVGEDLVAMTKCRLQARNFMSQDGGASTKKIKRQTSAMPLNNVSACSVNDNFVLFHSLDSSDLESTATSRVKRSKVEAKHSLQEEIREINQHLIDTVVSICDEDSDSVAAAATSGEGIIVKCSFSAVAFSPSLKAHFALMHTDPIAPLKLLVPANYPKASPQLLDKPSFEHSKEFEDLSVKAKSTFSVSLRSLSQPMSLGEMVRTWDACARKVIVEYAQQSGGGSFSSSYGTWHNCVGA